MQVMSTQWAYPEQENAPSSRSATTHHEWTR
jgi:hypothetical protein